MMLGLLLARAGVRVVVLEKHADFFRDFRGDTIHPSTLEIIEELGFLEELLALPHQKTRVITGQIGDTTLTLADFGHLPVTCKFIAFMPQWDFLDFLARKARAFPNFRLEMNAEVTGLVFDGDRVTGVRIQSPPGERELRADLVVGADGRSSTKARYSDESAPSERWTLPATANQRSSDRRTRVQLFDGGHTQHPKADIVVTVDGIVVETSGRAREGGIEEP